MRPRKSLSQRTKSARNYKPPAEARQRTRDERYVEFILSNKPRSQVNRQLGTSVNCQTRLNGSVVWPKREYKAKPGEFYKLRVVVGDRCPNEATTSVKSPDGLSTRHHCAEHIGIEYIKEDGTVMKYDA